MQDLLAEDKSFNNDELSLKDLFVKLGKWVRYLITKKWSILTAILFGLLFGILYSKYQKIYYKAELTFTLEDEKSNGRSGIGLFANQFGFDLSSNTGGLFSGGNLIEFMKSRLMIERALLSDVSIKGEAISLAEYYIRNNNLRAEWKNSKELFFLKFIPNSDRRNFSLKQDSVLMIIYEKLSSSDRLSISQKIKNLSITSIEVNNEDPIFAKLFCEKLAKVSSEYYTEIKTAKAKKNVDILIKQSDSIRAELNYGINGVAFSNDQLYNLNPSLNIKKTSISKRQIEIQTNTIIYNQLITNLESAKINLINETPLIQVINYPKFPLKKTESKALRSTIYFGFMFFFLIVLYHSLIITYKNIMK
jgi:hypothetical protein